MRAMVLNRYGADAEFVAVDLSRPEPSAGEVLVRVAATSVNTVDTMIRAMGDELPFAPQLPALLGMDFAGTVERVGPGVDHLKAGDEVYGCAGGLSDLPGAMADYIAADARLVAKKPASLSMREAAALPLVGITAYEGLARAGVTSGQKVLVHGGGGGVGHVAVQLARYRGAEVFATCSNERQARAIRSYGATPIDYRNESVADYVQRHTGGVGFDVVFDSVGGQNMANSFAAAALNGHVATTVSLVELDLSEAHFKGLSLHVVFMLIPMLHGKGREAHQAILKDIADIADAGHLRPLVDAVEFSLEAAAQAYAHLASGTAVGKVVMNV